MEEDVYYTMKGEGEGVNERECRRDGEYIGGDGWMRLWNGRSCARVSQGQKVGRGKNQKDISKCKFGIGARGDCLIPCETAAGPARMYGQMVKAPEKSGCGSKMLKVVDTSGGNVIRAFMGVCKEEKKNSRGQSTGECDQFGLPDDDYARNGKKEVNGKEVDYNAPDFSKPDAVDSQSSPSTVAETPEPARSPAAAVPTPSQGSPGEQASSNEQTFKIHSPQLPHLGCSMPLGENTDSFQTSWNWTCSPGQTPNTAVK
jgi:hypothetical protein